MGNEVVFEEKKDLEALGAEDQQQIPSASSQSTRDDHIDVVESGATEQVQLPPPPDGGIHAWLKVFGGFLIYINIW